MLEGIKGSWVVYVGLPVKPRRPLLRESIPVTIIDARITTGSADKPPKKFQGVLIAPVK